MNRLDTCISSIKASHAVFEGRWTVPVLPSFAYCIIYALSRASVPTERAVKFFPASKKKIQGG